jgi:hypothetical protein
MSRFPGITLLNGKYCVHSVSGGRDLIAVGFSEICLPVDCNSKASLQTDFTSEPYRQTFAYPEA